MKIIELSSFLIIILIVIVRGLWPDSFNLDGYSVALLFLLAIPLLAPFLKKAKWFGAEFDFKGNVSELEKIVDKQAESDVENASEELNNDEEYNCHITLNTYKAKELVTQDPNLALASLRIEIEKTLSFASKILLQNNKHGNIALSKLIRDLFNKGIIDEIQREAFNKITKLCNGAIHGAYVSEEDALTVILIAEELSNSFGVGYSINVNPNENFEEQGLFCEWEHCIEHFPLKEKRDDGSCHVFGHDCSGGLITSINCRENE